MAASDRVLALDFTGAGIATGTGGTTTSTSYTATLTAGSAAGVSFVAPTSGKVLVIVCASAVNSGANATYAGFRLTTGGTPGSGTEVTAAADSRALINTGTSLFSASRSHLVTGLTPGSTYSAQQRFRVAAGTGTFDNLSIIVIPLPA